jgi:hypothetical protein
LALVAPNLTSEPVPNQYRALTRSLEEYFEATLRDLDEFTELEDIVLTNEFNLFEEGIPKKRFNILMNFDLSATYSDDAIKIPDEESLFLAVRDFGISAGLITDAIRTLTPFETVVEVIFSVSDLESPP